MPGKDEGAGDDDILGRSEEILIGAGTLNGGMEKEANEAPGEPAKQDMFTDLVIVNC